MSETQEPKNGISRRDFLKASGLVAVAVQTAGIAGAALAAGKDKDSYTGYESWEGEQQTFNRKRFEIDDLPYKQVGETSRPGRYTDLIFMRAGIFMHALAEGWTEEDGVDALGEPLASWYKENPDALALDIERETVIMPRAAEDHEKYDDYFALADAYAFGWEDIFAFYPAEPTTPPEVSDFTITHINPGMTYDVPIREDPRPFKSEDHAAELIKKVAHRYGATIVGITKLNPDFLYDAGLRGSDNPGPFEKPEHWEYAIVMGVPHEWEQVLSNPAHGTSYDGYNRVRNASGRMASFLKYLGYPARSHHPPFHYDLVVPPIAVDAGLGQTGRHGFTIIPETGSNIRLACVTTNLPMTIDKPIDFGVAGFCNECKICADNCPSGAISFEDSPEGMVLRGYEHWYIDTAKCFNFWQQAMGPLGCRLCLTVCPYSRRSNWLHNLAKDIDVNDPTGLANNVLIYMQKNLFEAPDVTEYLRPPDGRFAGYREAPEWLQVTDWFDIDPTNPQKGD
jgi:epoxyqueuosine reductase